MNVLHVVPAVAARYGGPSTAALEMCRALQVRGVQVLLATSDADGRGRLDAPAGVEALFHGVSAIVFPRRGGESFKWTPALAHWLRAQVGRFDAVHVHAVFSHASLAAGGACRSAGVPYVLRPLGSLDPWSLSRHRFRKRALVRLAAGRLLRGASAVHYTSTGEQQLAEAGVPGLPRGVVIPLGVSEDLFSSPGDPSVSHRAAPYVLALARLDPKKGLDLLIAAFHAVEAEAAWRLVIAGDGDPAYVSYLRGLAQAGAARARIDFRGWVDGADRLTLLRGASLSALPSQQENFGIGLVEAMACGVPVVVTPGVNLASDIAREGAGWVVDRDPTAVAEALRTAMRDGDERRRRAAAARRFADQFRWLTVADRLLALYDDVASRTATPHPAPSTEHPAPSTQHR